MLSALHVLYTVQLSNSFHGNNTVFFFYCFFCQTLCYFVNYAVFPFIFTQFNKSYGICDLFRPEMQRDMLHCSWYEWWMLNGNRISCLEIALHKTCHKVLATMKCNAMLCNRNGYWDFTQKTHTVNGTKHESNEFNVIQWMTVTRYASHAFRANFFYSSAMSLGSKNKIFFFLKWQRIFECTRTKRSTFLWNLFVQSIFTFYKWFEFILQTFSE